MNLKKSLSIIPETLLLILTFLLPLKFGSTVGVPEMPMTYWNDPVAILVAAWPIMLFPLFAAGTLALTLFCIPVRQEKNLRWYALLWCALSLFSLTGWIHATTWDFAAQNTAYTLGLACYALALMRCIENDPAFCKWLQRAVITGLIFSIYSAVNQYLSGFDDTLKYIENKEKISGVQILEGQFGNRLKEARVSGDFTVCNSYAGYLVLTFPLLIGNLWKLGNRVTPPLPAKLLLTLPCAALFLFLLKETGSRGGILALLAGMYLTILCIKLSTRWKIFCYSLIPIGLAGFWAIVKLGRGYNSMLIRFDYFQAAIKMMFAQFAGAGWGEFFNDYLILKNVVNDEAPHAPHNFLLAFGSQTGVIPFLLAGIVLLLPLAAAVLYFSGQVRGAEKPENTAVSAGLLCGIGAWTFHSMLELNYETVASTGIAIVISMIILYNLQQDTQPVQLPLPGFPEKKTFSFLFFLLCSVFAVAALLYTPQVIKAEINFDALHSSTDLRFSQDPTKRPQPQEVYDMLKKCDPRSPFPAASASYYFQSLGPFYFDESLSLLEKAIEKAPKRSAYYFRKYVLLKSTGKYPGEAEKALKKARELSPKNPRYYPDGVTPYGRTSY